jgi:hypothetical protein
VNQIFKIDPSEMMLAFHDEAKIVMPAHFLRESGAKISSAFELFSDSAQRMVFILPVIMWRSCKSLLANGKLIKYQV